jgi:hypothetical protein
MKINVKAYKPRRVRISSQFPAVLAMAFKGIQLRSIAIHRREPPHERCDLEVQTIDLLECLGISLRDNGADTMPMFNEALGTNAPVSS